MNNSEKIKCVKEVFNKFLRDNNIYDAWYERYRLDNAMYNDDIPFNEFVQGRINEGEHGLTNLFYSGIQGTCMTSKEGDVFIEENKQCDIASNGDMIDADEKWMNTWRSLFDLEKLELNC